MEKTKLGEAHTHKFINIGDGAKPHHRDWAEGPITVPRQLGFWPFGQKPKLPLLGRQLESWFGLG